METLRRRSGVFIVNFEHISHLFLVFLLLTLNKLMLYGIVLTWGAALNLPKVQYNYSLPPAHQYPV